MAKADSAASAPPQFLQLAAHPVRWQLLGELARSDRRVRELVELVDQPQNLVSYHLRLLRDGGLVRARRSSHDGRDSYYHLDLERCADGLSHVGAALHPWLQAAPTPPRVAVGAPRILFVCTGNSARSPIAEALLRHLAGDRVTVASAGTSPKDRIHPHAVRVLHERYGIDIRDQAPRSIADVAGPGHGFDRVITVCDKAREHLPARITRHRAHWSVRDPAGARGPGDYSTFVSISTDIDTRVRQLIPTLGATATPAPSQSDTGGRPHE
ncbi:ArsR family transcriptional regulator [Nocardioides sp.]|uniref:arsenate reductase/protein-tyrosine-phosphatase family protein n=1 Tax=Nocardioides sp. TaxID=35761 RepID=UPI0025E28641|nr:ArsR family transcriptional regulator [Nocardioides sp.]